MGNEDVDVAPRSTEVQMVEQEGVRRMGLLAQAGWSSKRISQFVGVARNSVKRYLRKGREAES